MLNIEQQQKIIEVMLPFQPKWIGVFGSFARGDNKESSDIDLLVDFKNDSINLLQIIGIEQDLEKKFNRKIQLVTNRALNPNLRPNVEKDLKIIFQ